VWLLVRRGEMTDNETTPRKFYRCAICGFIQEDAIETGAYCDKCGFYDWEFAYEE
jgi:rubrerythrin